MEKKLHAEIISYNMGGEAVCASAARISTTPGNALEIFTAAKDNPQNRTLIGKVLKSGHKSVIEHAVFTLAMRDVSVFVEQFFIECRLASFTVKSRRYVDFSGLGCHVPPELEGERLTRYQAYMDMLFSAYQDLLLGGVPKEDARFLLPYSFHSNFYCTVNARELGQIIREIRCGRGRGIPELQCLADEITGQLETLFPALLPELERPETAPAVAFCCQVESQPVFLSQEEAGAVALLGGPADPMALLEAACHAAGFPPDKPLDWDSLIHSSRPRELEQLAYTFRISNLTLSGITHLVRHRMQSVIVPSLASVNHSRVIVPDTVAAQPALLERYQKAVREANRVVCEIAADPILCRYHYYFALSGNLMDVMTTMNAREIKLITRLRTCSRAQWEIRAAAIALLRQLRQSFPELFGRFGPSCFLTGRCPEGQLSCGRAEEMTALFQNLS